MRYFQDMSDELEQKNHQLSVRLQEMTSMELQLRQQ